MTEEQYKLSIKETLGSILIDQRFNNYKNQIFVQRLGVEFNSTYEGEYLWNRALYLGSNGAFILPDSENQTLALRSLKEAAEIYEYLGSAEVRTPYDKAYCMILSAICYDLAGYQANSQCLIKNIQTYELISEDPHISIGLDNYILLHIQKILSKQIPEAKSLINKELAEPGARAFNDAVEAFYDHILKGDQNNFADFFYRASNFFLNSANVHISHLLFLLSCRVNIYKERSIGLNVLNRIGTNPIWNKYVKLLANDYYLSNKVKPLNERVSKFEFWTSQLRAVEKGLLETSTSFTVQMPTSAGKTFIAELSILDSLVKYPNKKCIYIAPFRALTNEKELELSKYLSKLGYSVSSLSGSYETDVFQDFIIKETNVLVATPEKIDLLFRLKQDFFENVSLVVVDEGHIIGNIDERSSLLEFLIIKLKIKIPSLRIIFVSAVMPTINAEQFSKWLSGEAANIIKSNAFKDSEEEWEPTRKLLGKFSWLGKSSKISYFKQYTEDEDTNIKKSAFTVGLIKSEKIGTITFPKKGNNSEVAARLAYELSTQGHCLIFCSQVRFTESVGSAVLRLFDLIEQTGAQISSIFSNNTQSESYYFSLLWYGADSYITKCIQRRIGIHFGDMAESVRRSVEQDYQKGSLRILISTNTIGQGLNFPIKNLIIHSYNITRGENIKVRDFWNIIGRAGRATKETEGQIIFLPDNQQLYEQYTNKDKIENASSILFLILKELVDRRLSLDDQDPLEFTENHVLNLLSEEVLGTEDERFVNAIIENSLFRIQALDSDLDVSIIKLKLLAIVAKIKEEIVDPLLIKCFGKTGLSLNSNKAINLYIDENLVQIRNCIEEDDYQGLLRLILTLFDNKTLKEIESDKLRQLGNTPGQYLDFIKQWIEGAPLDMLQGSWLLLNGDQSKLNIFLSEALYYRYVWGITSFLTLLSYKINIPAEKFPTNIKNLAGYMKYGVSNPTACFLRGLGIKNREVSNLLATKSNNKLGESLLKWVSNLGIDDIKGWQINEYDIQNILDISYKLNIHKTTSGTPSTLSFYIRGIWHDTNRRIISKTVSLGDKLTYKREEQNPYDPFAIKLFYLGQELGYVPKEYSRLISTEIDLNEKNYTLQILNIAEENEYNNIKIEMCEN